MTLSGASFSNVLDPAFLSLAASWTRDQADQLLGFVWAAYDQMRATMPVLDRRSLERSITQALEPRIRSSMSGYEPFYVQHSPFEYETMESPPAQPPTYDIAFVLHAEERVMWPLEAKVLETPKKIRDYERDVREEYLTCRYAPFSGAGAMLGYLLSGSAADALANIEAKLGCMLEPIPAFVGRPHRMSSHRRAVPVGKIYPADFRCYHLILNYSGLTRSSRKLRGSGARSGRRARLPHED
jgi:hypothetical protein